MEHIEQLIETVLDETGIFAVLTVEPVIEGWRASITEDGELLLCPAGERYLVAHDDQSMYNAITKLDQLIAKGYAQYERERA